MTRQDMFNRAYRGVIAQGGKGRCVYFDPETNRRCGVGHVLTLPVAKAWSERNEPGVRTVSLRAVEEFGMDYDEHVDFLESLQLAHDYGDFKENMKALAEKCGLRVCE